MFRLIFAFAENPARPFLESSGRWVCFLAFVACFVILSAPVGSQVVLLALSRLEAKQRVRSWGNMFKEYRKKSTSVEELIASRYVGYVERTLVTLCVMFNLAVFLIPIFAAKIQLRQNLETSDTQYSTYVFIGSMVSAAWAVAIGLIGASVLNYCGVNLNLKELCSSCYLSVGN